MTAVLGASGLDVDALGPWLSSLGLRHPVQVQRIGEGQSNLTSVATDADGRRVVLRRPPLGKLLASAHDVRREGRVMAALDGTAVPCPRILGLHEDGEVPVLAMEHVDGVVMDDVTKAEAQPEAWRHAVGLGLARALGAVHAVDLEARGLTDLASHKPYAARQLKRWSRQWEDSRTRELPAVESLADRLAAAMPASSELTLVHGDLHLLNVICDPEDGTIRAVLDWELSTLGDPLADLGGLLAYWPRPGDPATSLFPAPALPGFPERAELVHAYGEATGRDTTDVGFWHVLGLWKIAVIAEGVLRRAIDEPRNAAATTRVDPQVVDDLVHRAEVIAAEVGL